MASFDKKKKRVEKPRVIKKRVEKPRVIANVMFNVYKHRKNESNREGLTRTDNVNVSSFKPKRKINSNVIPEKTDVQALHDKKHVGKGKTNGKQSQYKMRSRKETQKEQSTKRRFHEIQTRNSNVASPTKQFTTCRKALVALHTEAHSVELMFHDILANLIVKECLRQYNLPESSQHKQAFEKMDWKLRKGRDTVIKLISEHEQLVLNIMETKFKHVMRRGVKSARVFEEIEWKITNCTNKLEKLASKHEQIVRIMQTM